MKSLLKCKERELAACEKNLLTYKKEFCELMETLTQKNAEIKVLNNQLKAKPSVLRDKENILQESIAAFVKQVSLY